MIGILALQGAVGPHQEKLQALGVPVLEVRTPKDLARVDALIIPGGESSTFLHLLKINHLWQPLAEFVKEKPTWGICAGAILLAKKVSHPEQDSFACIDVDIERNAYGRQINSFVDTLATAEGLADMVENLEGVFIRAPIIKRVGASAKVLARYKDDPVMVQEKNILISTFHPELTDSTAVHSYFFNRV